MRRLRIFGAAIGFLTVGFAVGHEYARRSMAKSYAEHTEREISEARESYFDKLEAFKEESDERDVEDVVTEEVINEDGESIMASKSVVSYENYSKFAEARKREEDRQAELKKPVEEELPDADGSEVYEDYDDMDDDYDEGKYHPENVAASDSSDYETPTPFELTVDEFMDPMKRYDEISLQYFREDKIVVDTSMVPVPDPEVFVGEFLLVFDKHREGDTDVIFIRNNHMRVDIELIVEDDETFSEATERWRNQRALSKARRSEKDE